jgi:hypothetical protein
MSLRSLAASTLSVLAIGATEGCESSPVIEHGITITDPELDRELKCTREQFQNVAFYSQLNGNGWADENCPGFDDKAKELIEMENPLSELVEIRKQILAKAGIDPMIETWLAPASVHENKMYVMLDPASVAEARCKNKIK